MDTKGIEQLSAALQGISPAGPGADGAAAPGGADFSAALRSAIEQVNGAQEEAGRLAKAFELGQPDVNVQDVMVALQKANVSFQTMVQVRNRLVSAYQEIMNMQV